MEEGRSSAAAASGASKLSSSVSTESSKRSIRDTPAAHVARPSYEEVYTGLTGHAEVVAIEYDANIVSYDDLLDIFWICHDPTTLEPARRPTKGPQYRSAIILRRKRGDKRRLAEKSRQKANAARGSIADPIVTETRSAREVLESREVSPRLFSTEPQIQEPVLPDESSPPRLRSCGSKLNAKAQAEKETVSKR